MYILTCEIQYSYVASCQMGKENKHEIKWTVLLHMWITHFHMWTNIENVTCTFSQVIGFFHNISNTINVHFTHGLQTLMCEWLFVTCGLEMSHTENMAHEITLNLPRHMWIFIHFHLWTTTEYEKKIIRWLDIFTRVKLVLTIFTLFICACLFVTCGFEFLHVETKHGTWNCMKFASSHVNSTFLTHFHMWTTTEREKKNIFTHDKKKHPHQKLSHVNYIHFPMTFCFL